MKITNTKHQRDEKFGMPDTEFVEKFTTFNDDLKDLLMNVYKTDLDVPVY